MIQTITLAQLKEGTQDYTLPKKGQLKLKNLKVERTHSFLEYVFGGCEVDLTIAVDFTLSNGDPRSRDSLHFFDPAKNQYLQAIQSVGSILQFYNTDKQIQLYGFGGAVAPYYNRASHCFALNGNIFNPRIDGLEGVTFAYQHALNNAKLYGPTHFAPILKEVNNMVESVRVSQ